MRKLNYMRKLLVMLVFAIVFALNISSAWALQRFKPSDFIITKVSTDMNGENPVMLVSIYFKQSSATMLPYPTLSLVTNAKGDTLATAYTEFFCHNGQDTVTYTVNLRKTQLPKFEDCRFHFSGPFENTEEGINCWLIYSPTDLLVKPEVTLLNCSEIKITGIEIYHPDGILPQLYISVCFNSPSTKMLLAPYIKSIKTLTGKVIAAGFADNIEFYYHRGQDTLVYRSFLTKNKIPNLAKCEFYFCCPGNENGKDAICKLRYLNAAVVGNRN